MARQRDDWVEACDYCGRPDARYLRPIGFTQLEIDGPRYPLVKVWCRDCEPNDTIDLEARAAIVKPKPGGDSQ